MNVAEKENIEINTEELEKKAKEHELSESFETLKKSDEYKVGIGVRIPKPSITSYFLEIVLPICEEGETLDISKLKKRIDLFEKLEELDYKFKCEKDNSVICEKKIGENNLKEELEHISFLMKE